MMESKLLEKITTEDDTFTVFFERITQVEYVEFLSRTDLGQQYPKERFIQRIQRLVSNTQISLIVRDIKSVIIGICFGLTDFAYWLLVTDLGIDRKYVKKGLGSRLVKLARDLAGGKDDIIQFIYANENAVGFYEKNGMKKSTCMMELTDVEWTCFEVGKDDPIASGSMREAKPAEGRTSPR